MKLNGQSTSNYNGIKDTEHKANTFREKRKNTLVKERLGNLLVIKILLQKTFGKSVGYKLCPLALITAAQTGAFHYCALQSTPILFFCTKNYTILPLY